MQFKKIAKMGSFPRETVHTGMELGRLGFGSWDIGPPRLQVAAEAAFSSPFFQNSRKKSVPWVNEPVVPPGSAFAVLVSACDQCVGFFLYWNLEECVVVSADWERRYRRRERGVWRE